MKAIAYCASALLAFSLVSCGGKNIEDVKTLNDAKDLTQEQTDLAIDYALDYLQNEIDLLDAEMDEAKVIDDAARSIGAAFIINVEYDKEGRHYSKEVYEKRRDELIKKTQELEKKKDEVELWRENFKTKHNIK